MLSGQTASSIILSLAPNYLQRKPKLNMNVAVIFVLHVPKNGE